MSRKPTPLECGGNTPKSPSVAVRRKLGKVPPKAPSLLGSRSVTCSLCQRGVFANLLLAHKQEAHGDAIYSRTANGRPRNIWFGPPPVAQAPIWRRPAGLRPVFSR